MNQSPQPSATTYNNGYRFERNGWIFLHIEGEPYERGYQHGYLLADELRTALKAIAYLIYNDVGIPFSWFAANAEKMWLDMLASDQNGKLGDRSGSRLLAELNGIVDGANAKTPDALPITLADILAWNGYPELICQWFPAVASHAIQPIVPIPQEGDPVNAPITPHPELLHRWQHFHHHSCSAFVATGDWTREGGIVIAQTTWQRFSNGDAYNIILDLEPPQSEGQRLIMQSVPGYVASSTDFWVNSSGLVIAETSINGSGFDPTELPEFFRARRASQGATTIEDWRELFRFGNNGGYTNSWLLAESTTGRIACYELTLNHDILQPPIQSGYYIGCNIPIAVPIRNLDCANSGYDNIAISAGRRVRFEMLMARHKGQIDAEIGKKMLSDHYDVLTKKNSPSSRTICGHFDCDNNQFGGGHQPYYPWGSLDGKITTASMAKEMRFSARWGRACGEPFDARRFFKDNPQYSWLKDYTRDRPTQPWVNFQPGEPSHR